MSPSSNEHVSLLRRHAELESELESVRTRLALGASKPPLPREPVDLLMFGVEDERFALSLSYVDEVVPIARLVPLPEAPPWIAGVLDLRGRLVPVIDVAKRVHRRTRPPVLEDAIIVCTVAGRTVGLLVDGVPELDRTPHDRLRESPPDVPLAPYVWAILEHGSTSCTVLDVPTLVGFSTVPSEGPT